MITDINKRLGAAVHELRDLIVGLPRFISPQLIPRLHFLFIALITDPVQS